MENNVAQVKASSDLKEGAHALIDRAVDLAGQLIERGEPLCKVVRGGRKAQPLT